MAQNGPAFAPEDIDFDAFYRGEPPMAGSQLTFERVPWDIGEAQPEIVRLVEQGEVRDEVLDAGCGLGDNALLLAARGHRVVGVDGSPTAIREAERRAADKGLSVEFVVDDVTRLDGLDQRFSTVLDSALYHCLGAAQRAAYAAALHRVTKPGAQLHLFCFRADELGAAPTPGPVDEQDLRANLGGHWKILDLGRTHYTTNFSREELARVQPEIADHVDALRVDERGRVLAPVWHVHAERA